MSWSTKVMNLSNRLLSILKKTYYFNKILTVFNFMETQIAVFSLHLIPEKYSRTPNKIAFNHSKNLAQKDLSFDYVKNVF